MPPLLKASWQEPAKNDFSKALLQIQKRIHDGEIQKAVPVVFARSSQKVLREEKAQMILSLLKAPANLYVYGFWQSENGLLGATPEVLFDYSNQVLKTMALAGTCPKNEAAHRESLLADKKEMQEHGLVLEDILEVLKDLGEAKTRGPYIAELPTLYHLKTDIEIHCNQDPDFISLVNNLHPTPALGVAPRGFGYKWMKELPGQESRKAFGAPFALLTRKEALCLVAIRNLQWNNTECMIGSGCGVLAASELEREWQELYQKRLSVRKILGLEA
ncbi:chorismate-binding protein [Bdellovibrio reynosensis]|uniref:Chorismate-binding protein n=1 Tax=Bdellovibrio reynosensis TaxID=2835041 RepID=A0ABY4CEZ0_9BACT|nr:chorismate-binding protein [Bdellovibrio reynosensis]UOF00775.1 chorismate-binding protein [Bdellovibrio reynosensis]